MNYLQLVQSAIAECGASNTSVLTVVGATGEQLRFVNWVKDSWLEIQNKHEDWGFMRSSYLLNLPAGNGTSFTTTSGRSTYPLGVVAGTTSMVAAASLGKWDQYSFRNFSTANVLRSDEIVMDLITFDEWRNSYELGALRQVVTRPVAVAIAPDNTVCVGPPSNGLYTVEADYWVAPQTFALDADVPTGLQAQYHMLIVYGVMKKYAAYEAAPEVKTRADEEFGTMFRQLESKFGPQIMEAGALA